MPQAASQGLLVAASMLYWVAAKELHLSYHKMDIMEIIWFWFYGNLSSLTATQPCSTEAGASSFRPLGALAAQSGCLAASVAGPPVS